MSSMKLLISIVPHDKGEKLTRAAMESGCRGGTVIMGRGLARSNFMAVLGLGETTKDIIMMIVEQDVLKSVKNAILSATSHEKKNFGEIFCVDVDSVMKNGAVTEGEKNMPENCANELITVIVNRGYADDAMAAARSAGAGGGTVVNARGTARETDERFFGMHIVPEKDMLLIVVPSEKKAAVLEAIRNLPCLAKPGSGIAFGSPVDEFSILGKN